MSKIQTLLTIIFTSYYGNHPVENTDFAVEASNMQVHNSIDCSGGSQQIASVQVDDDDLRKAVCSLNLRQRKTFNIVCHWARNKLKQMNSVFENVVEPLHLFITGSAVAGKSHLLKILTSFLTKTFNLYSGAPDKKKILLLAPAGVAALNIDDTTIHLGLGNKSEL